MANELGSFHPEDVVLGTVVEVSHAFEVELNILIRVNHKLTIEGIAKLEEQEIRHTWEVFDDPEAASSHAVWQRQVYDDMRAAARNLAVVGLVTRLQHWIERLVSSNKIVASKTDKCKSKLAKNLQALNSFLQEGPPIAIEFFDQLATARDSVIHGDSKSEWCDDRGKSKQRKVAPYYRSVDNLEVTNEQLDDAIEKAVALVKWYEAKVLEQKSRCPEASS